MHKHNKLYFTLIIAILMLAASCNKTIIIDTSKKNSETNIKENIFNNSGDSFENFFSFHFKINGEELRLMMTYKELLDAGWTCGVDTDAKIIGKTGIPQLEFTKGDCTFQATLMNMSDYYEVAENTVLSSVNLDPLTAKGAVIELPKGIIIGKETQKTLVEKIGEASSTLTINERDETLWIYEYDKDENITFTFDKKTKKIKSAFMFQVKETFEIIPVPDAISSYSKVYELSNDIGDQTFSIDDEVYKMPVPVSQFYENGFTVNQFYIPLPEDGLLKNSESLKCQLVKNNISIPVTIKNFKPDNQTFENCYITGIEFDSTNLYSLEIGPNLSFNTNKIELNEALKNYSFEFTDSSMEAYFIDFTDRSSAIIYLDKQTDKIVYFELLNYPL